MGKANPRLRIWVDEEFLAAPWVEELREKGHYVSSLLYMGGGASAAEVPDLVLSRTAHMFTPAHERYLEAALKAARKRRKG